MISSDTSGFPLGVDRERGEDEQLVEQISQSRIAEFMTEFSDRAMQEIGEREVRVQGLDLDLTAPSVPSRKLIPAFALELDQNISDLKLSIVNQREEIVHLTELYHTLKRHCIEVQEWANIYEAHAAMLNNHIARKDRAAASAGANDDRNSLKKSNH